MKTCESHITCHQTSPPKRKIEAIVKKVVIVRVGRDGMGKLKNDTDYSQLNILLMNLNKAKVLKPKKPRNQENQEF